MVDVRGWGYQPTNRSHARTFHCCFHHIMCHCPHHHASDMIYTSSLITASPLPSSCWLVCLIDISWHLSLCTHVKEYLCNISEGCLQYNVLWAIRNKRDLPWLAWERLHYRQHMKEELEEARCRNRASQSQQGNQWQAEDVTKDGRAALRYWGRRKKTVDQVKFVCGCKERNDRLKMWLRMREQCRGLQEGRKEAGNRSCPCLQGNPLTD